MTLVVDASALVHATTEASSSALQLRTRLADELCHAPHLIDAEFGNVLRRKVRRDELVREHADLLFDAARSLIDHRHPHHGSLTRAAWSLRENLSFYDALYAALAAALGVPLLTTDQRLGRAANLPCRVEVLRA